MLKTQIAQATKAQGPQGMKATRHKIHMNMLGLNHLKQVKGEEQKSTYDTRHEQHEKKQGTRHMGYKSKYDA